MNFHSRYSDLPFYFRERSKMKLSQFLAYFKMLEAETEKLERVKAEFAQSCCTVLRYTVNKISMAALGV